MSRNIDTTEGGGPWRLRFDSDLQPGDTQLFDLQRMEFKGQKRYFAPWLPVDNVQIKNLDSSNPVSVELNSRYEVFVEANAVDSFEDAGVTSIAVHHEDPSGTAIPPENLALHISVDRYDADDAARERQQRHPVQNMVRGVFNL